MTASHHLRRFAGLLATSDNFYTSLSDPSSLILNYALVGFSWAPSEAFLCCSYALFRRRFGSRARRSYNLAYGFFGGLTPMLLTLWTTKDALAPAHYVALLASLGIVLAFVPTRQYE